MSISTNSKKNLNDDEIDLIPLINALWASKKTIIAVTLASTLVSLIFYASSPERWTASTYIAKSSFYSLYKELAEKDSANLTPSQPLEPKLYSALQNDIFNTATGLMISRSITLKEPTPKTGKNEPTLYIASVTAQTQEMARTQLSAALKAANAEAIALNLPTLASNPNLKAFVLLDETTVTHEKNFKKVATLGAILGFLLGSAFAIARLLITQYKYTNPFTPPT